MHCLWSVCAPVCVHMGSDDLPWPWELCDYISTVLWVLSPTDHQSIIVLKFIIVLCCIIVFDVWFIRDSWLLQLNVIWHGTEAKVVWSSYLRQQFHDPFVLATFEVELGKSRKEVWIERGYVTLSQSKHVTQRPFHFMAVFITHFALHSCHLNDSKTFSGEINSIPSV